MSSEGSVKPAGRSILPRDASIAGLLFGGERIAAHVIYVSVGEDIKEKILSFSQGEDAIVIVSGYGSISTVELRGSSETITYEGRFDILSLTGYYTRDHNDDPDGAIGHMNLLMAHPDISVSGGAVGKVLVAASTVQVVVGVYRRATTSMTKNIPVKMEQLQQTSETV